MCLKKSNKNLSNIIMQQNNLNILTAFQNMKQQLNKPLPINPATINSRLKQNLVSLNMSQSRREPIRQFSKYEHVIFSYVKSCNTGEIDKICDVQVIHEHALDVAKTYTNIGCNNFTSENNMNPVVLNIIGKEFTGTNYESCEGMRDETINLRTNLCNFTTKNNMFPLKENQAIYSSQVTVLRPTVYVNNDYLQLSEVYRLGLITVSPIQQDRFAKKMTMENFVKTLVIIESVFQCAIVMSHPVLVLVPFGHGAEDNNSVEDIIQIYNYCVMKYGHKFKKIIIAIPPFYQKEIYEIYNENILKPNEIVKKIDEKYEEIENEKMMENKLNIKLQPEQSTNNFIENNPDMQKQFQLFMQMMSNPNINHT